MDERDDYADNDQPPPKHSMPDLLRIVAVFGILGAIAVGSLLMILWSLPRFD